MSDADTGALAAVLFVGGAVAFLILRVFIVAILVGIVTTIGAILYHMVMILKPLWWLLGKSWVYLTKGAAIAILIIGIMYATGRGNRVEDGFRYTSNVIMKTVFVTPAKASR